jgi:hypothetical protein
MFILIVGAGVVGARAASLLLRSNDAALAPQHCSYIYVNITTNFIICKSVGDEINNITNLLKNR